MELRIEVFDCLKIIENSTHIDSVGMTGCLCIDFIDPQEREREVCELTFYLFRNYIDLSLLKKYIT